MGSHEIYSTESEWYTPEYVFRALGCSFDWDIAAAPDPSLTFVPAKNFCSRDSLTKVWSKNDFIWCNPPWAGRGNKQPWIDLVHNQGNGLLLTPDRSSAPWWQNAALSAEAVLFVSRKIKFTPGPGNFSNWKQPGAGTTIFAWGEKGIKALFTAEENGLGIVMQRRLILALPDPIINSVNT